MAPLELGTSDEQNKGTQWFLLVLLLSLTLVRGVLYIALTPPWQAPDENGHFEYAWLIAHFGRLPSLGEISHDFESELVSSLYEWRYGEFIGRPLPRQMPAQMNGLPQNIFAVRSRTIFGRFSLAYIWTAIFIWPFRHQDLLLQLYAARVASLALNVGIVWMTWCIFRMLLPGQVKMVTAMTAFVVFLPQHTFINDSVSEGPLAELCICIVLYGWLRLLLHNRVEHFITIVLGTLLGAWAKHTAALLIPLNVIMIFLMLSQEIRHRRYLYAGIAALAVLIVGITWRTPAGHFIRTILQQWWPIPQFFWENDRISLDQAVRYTFESFWAQFGWMNVRVSYGWYLIIYILTAFAVEGWIWPRSRLWSVPNRALWLMGVALLLAVVGWLIFTVTTPTGLSYYQGRYLFPAIVPIAFFIVGGWARNTPLSWQRYFAPFVIILLAALDTAALCLSFVPYFY
jgi:hypothetical protein